MSIHEMRDALVRWLGFDAGFIGAQPDAAVELLYIEQVAAEDDRR